MEVGKEGWIEGVWRLDRGMEGWIKGVRMVGTSRGKRGARREWS
jgi:hypothetical protein